MSASSPVLCIVGLGYVGLPLAHAFAKHGYKTIGYDISSRRIEELKNGHDRTLELSEHQLKEVMIHFSDDPAVMKEADVIILAIPTPIDDRNNPDLTLVEKASETVGKNIKKGAIVVYESTVYPGVTEEICAPIIERESGLKWKQDFHLGYSPERINPGDKQHTVETIIKIVSGDDEETLETLSDLYGSIVKAGIHRAPSIKVAEMAKAIENAQRDLNIAYVNEIAMLCTHLGIKSADVLSAAGTKWNFLPFKPGLVGGHCIGVDPYYLVEKAKQLGMTTHVISAGRLINDGMGKFVATQVVERLKTSPSQARALVLGLTFKEDVPDTRNSKVHDVVKALEEKGMNVEVHDPFLSDEEIAKMKHAPGSLENGPYDAVLLLVAHEAYKRLSAADLVNALKERGVLFDLKSIVDQSVIEGAGRTYLSL
ncbi:MAG TPA: nucleotide sugar dehydrogenase [Candidatus Peribacteraceae bacterium]|nr:nucleotide sugar dehydrogenase [Candidatus Peribacteraceae bacterium]